MDGIPHMQGEGFSHIGDQYYKPRTDARSVLDIEHLHASVRNSMANGSTPTPIIVGPVGRISPLTRNNQPTRRIITTATGALKLLKALK